ncbi:MULTISPECIES: HlyD family efflux transporter periplasmic adaptor subunit [Streptomyces]|uniref:HlyD family efflux transporter periplasmic adaptor subunit n=1 Tax=Streptomyces lycii TaxID=2654337 RepID=A0ABQ7FMB3_9ACTN|nr:MULTISPECIES: HlyD family efflux transporter periplasmic adaptor subunit [Streptomyces]KAF4410086.1 HlyD family efflux transporter periplasmic adaptor subunit [Streptomyces lycii]PGH51984.1 hypothetical protein CRI70_03770 [Streptomyces sp. Ru87]
MQFRQKALSKLQSPEELDLPVRFARPRGWLVLAVTLCAMAGATFWAVTGTVVSKVTAPGILTHAEGSYILQSPVSGQVTAILAREGESVPKDAPLLNVRTGDGQTRAVRAVAAGRVTSLVAKIGSVVTTGSDVATVERVGSPGDPLIAMLYVPGSSGASISPGADVDLKVQSAPSQQFGVLLGKVKAVGRAPQTRQQITGFLGDAQLGEQFSEDGKPMAVLVELKRSKDTKSGYAWSQDDGPPFELESTSLVDADIHQSEEHPIDWLLP